MSFQPSPLQPQLYYPPSSEARRLVRLGPWLVSPTDGKPGVVARLVLMAMIAPMTQLTFVSFHLQSFLFLVFHRKWPSLIGHGVFMTAENLFILAALRPFALGRVNAAVAYALLLLVWYGVVAWQERLLLWFGVCVVLVGGLYALSAPVAELLLQLHVPVWSAILVSAFLIAASHTPEKALPPRAAGRFRWIPLFEFTAAPGISVVERLGRILRVAMFTVWGTLDECWAAPRLMPYNYLMVMMRFGYAPQLAGQLNGWCEDAWQNGEPAIDYVGTGGGTFLAASVGE